MQWTSVLHPTLNVPQHPAPDQLAVTYCAGSRQYAIGYWRGGTWLVQPPLSGTVTHWMALTPPAVTPVPPQGAKKDPTKSYSVPPPPPFKKP